MSDRPVAERLQVKNDRTLVVIGAAPELDASIGALDVRSALPDADVVLVAMRNLAELEATLRATIAQAGSAAIIWLAYPKLSSPLASDLSRDVIRDSVPRFGLDSVSQIAIDADWSALRLKRNPKGS